MKKKFLLLMIIILSLFAISCSNQTVYDTQIKDSDISSGLSLETDSLKKTEIKDNAETKKEYNENVSEELKERLEIISDDEYISVSVYLVSPKHSPLDISEEYIDRIVENRVVVFARNLKLLNEDRTVPLIFKDLTGKQFKELSQINDDIYTDEEMDGMIENSSTVEEIYSLYEHTKRVHYYRQRVKEANQTRNSEFCDMLDMNQCKDIYKSPLLSLVHISCKKSYILELQEISIVSDISYNDPNVFFAQDITD